MVTNTSQPQTGGDAIVNSLIANGVDTVFGLPGAQIYPLFDSLKRNEARIRTVGARHEQGVAYMALCALDRASRRVRGGPRTRRPEYDCSALYRDGLQHASALRDRTNSFGLHR